MLTSSCFVAALTWATRNVLVASGVSWNIGHTSQNSHHLLVDWVINAQNMTDDISIRYLMISPTLAFDEERDD